MKPAHEPSEVLHCYFKRESFERVLHQISDVAVIVVAAVKLRLVFPDQRARRDRSYADLKAVPVPFGEAVADGGMFAVGERGRRQGARGRTAERSRVVIRGLAGGRIETKR